MDPEFKVLEDVMTNDSNTIEMVYVAAQQHLPEIKCAIRLIKELYHEMYHRLPYKAIPVNMVKAAAGHIIKWLNMFPPKEECQCIIVHEQ